MGIDEKRRIYFERIAQGDEPFVAAGYVTADPIERWQIANDWGVPTKPIEPETTSFEKLTEEQFLEKVQERMLTCSDRQFAAIAKIYAEARGFIKKEISTTVNVPGVMLIPNASTDDWKKMAENQQRELKERAERIANERNSVH